MNTKTKNKPKKETIEILMEGKGGELHFLPMEATSKNIDELMKKTPNSLIKHNLQKQKKKFQTEK